MNHCGTNACAIFDVATLCNHWENSKNFFKMTIMPSISAERELHQGCL